MVASLRCGELKDEALALIAPKSIALKEQSERYIVEGFASKCEALIKEAKDHYDEFAH